MKLARALSIASRFMGKGKDAPDVLRRVRLFANEGGYWVQATDGVVGCLIRSDTAFPEMTISAEDLPLLKKHEIGAVSAPDEGGRVAFRLDGGGVFATLPQSVEQFPPIPPGPSDLTLAPDWDQLKKCFLAVMKPGGEVGGLARPDLEHVRFRPDRVEVTDAAKVVIADVPTPVDGCIHANVFRGWSRGKVALGDNPTHIWFRIGDDEFRYAAKWQHTYASGVDLRSIATEYPTGGTDVVCGTAELLDALDKSHRVSPTGIVALGFDSETLEVTSVVAQSEFGHRVKLGLGARPLEPTVVPIGGKWLSKFLKQLKTPRVRLQVLQDERKRWLRVESGALVANIFQAI